MTLNFKFAGVYVRIDSDTDIKQSGHSPVFLCKNNSRPDIVYKIKTAKLDAIPEKSVKNPDSSYSYTDYRGVCHKAFFDLDKNKTYADLLYETSDSYTLIIDEEYKETISDMYYLVRVMDLPGAFLKFGRLMLHASYCDIGGEALLFAGLSGAGKSTQADLWEKYENAVTVNGDKCFVYSKNGQVYAGSLPVAGTSGKCLDRDLPVRLIVFPIKDKENKITKLRAVNAIASLMKCSVFDIFRRENQNTALGLCADIVSRVSLCSLNCLPDDGAVNEVKSFMNSTSKAEIK